MSTLCNIISICLVLLVINHQADGLNCYRCTGCNDPFSSSVATTAVGASGDYCTKISSSYIVNRGTSSSCSAVNVLGNGQWCCQTDYCNSASKLISTSSIALALMATVLFKFF